jgi:carbamoyl-phosphate synthase large subunit
MGRTMTAAGYSGRRVWVTGGAGVIGRELLETLCASEASVLCCDLKPPPCWLAPAVTYVEGDANDLTVERVAEFGPEYCFHLAATFERTTESEGFWAEDFHVASIAGGISSMRRMVFASSYLTYDPALYLFPQPQASPVRLSETAAVRPRNLCGGAKLMHEEELDFLGLFASTPFTSVSARIFRSYGRGSQDIVSRWVRGLIAEPDTPLSTYRVEGLFDYVYAGDVADGLLRLGASEATGAVNLGSGHARRVSELLDILTARFPRTRWEQEPADIPFEAHEAELSRLEQLTGWRPSTSLEQGVDILIEHERGARRG